MTEAPHVRSRMRLRIPEWARRTMHVETAPHEPIRNLYPDMAVVFLPGVFLRAGDKSVTAVAKPLADVFDMKSLAISVKTPKKDSGSPQREAAEINKRLKEYGAKTGINKFIVVGASYGGSVAMSVTANNEHVVGAVLIDPRGLNHQPKLLLEARATADAFGTVGDRVRRPRRSRGERSFISRYTTDSVNNALQDAFYGQVGGTIEACIAKNPDSYNIQVPVSFITGSNDLLAHPDEILPYASRKDQSGQEGYMQRHYFRRAPQVRVNIIDGGWHGHILGNPYTVAGIARSALEDMGVMPQGSQPVGKFLR